MDRISQNSMAFSNSIYSMDIVNSLSLDLIVDFQISFQISSLLLLQKIEDARGSNSLLFRLLTL
jgi:hypothetical protein